MRYRVALLPEADQEFREAIAWHAQQRKGLGRRFASAVKHVLKRLRAMPKVHPIIFEDIRRAVVKGFSYIVLYRVLSSNVLVISIFHTSRDPNEWQRRS